MQLFANGPRGVSDCERQAARLGDPAKDVAADVEVRSVTVDGDAATVETEGGPNRVWAFPDTQQ